MPNHLTDATPDQMGNGRRNLGRAVTVPPATIDAVLAASRALVGVAASSIAVLDDDITLPQFRALVLVANGGVRGPGDLAVALDVHPSNATRVVDRMVAKELLERTESEHDRRTISLSIGRAGRAALQRVTEKRQTEIEAILSRLSTGRGADVAKAFAEFATAAGEAADEAWRLGWGS